MIARMTNEDIIRRLECGPIDLSLAEHAAARLAEYEREIEALKERNFALQDKIEIVYSREGEVAAAAAARQREEDAKIAESHAGSVTGGAMVIAAAIRNRSAI